MKAILEFDLPEEDDEHKLALDGWKWKSACSEFAQWLRSIQKHGDQKTLKVEEVRSRFYEELNSAGLNLD